MFKCISWTCALLALLCVSARAATIDVTVQNFQFSPNDITINAGDTVRWTNHSGTHTVTADDNSFSSGSPSSSFTFSRTFNQAGVQRYYCAVHSAPGLSLTNNMNGRITVNAAAPTFNINQGISGAWFNPATAGQGFLMDVRPSDKFIFIAWFTFDTSSGTLDAAKVGSSEQRWLTAQGNYNADTATAIPIFRTSGGAFNDPRATTTVQVGTMTLNFSSCTAGTIAYTLTSDSLSGSIPIQRVIPGTELLCQTLSAP